MSGFFVSPTTASSNAPSTSSINTTQQSSDKLKYGSGGTSWYDGLYNLSTGHIISILIVIGLVILSVYIYYYGDQGATTAIATSSSATKATKAALDGLHNYLTNPQYSDRMEMV